MKPFNEKRITIVRTSLYPQRLKLLVGGRRAGGREKPSSVTKTRVLQEEEAELALGCP